MDKGMPNSGFIASHGDNGEPISHFRCNSASDEVEEQHVIDERRQRRMLFNKESAKRSRLRKQQHLDEPRAQMVHLMIDNKEILKKCNVASQHYVHITKDNCLQRSEAMELSHKLQRLQHTLNAQFHGAFGTMGGEARNCSATHLNSKYITNSPPVFLELWF